MQIDVSNRPLNTPYYVGWIKTKHQYENGKQYTVTDHVTHNYSTLEEACEALSKVPEDGNERGIYKAVLL